MLVLSLITCLGIIVFHIVLDLFKLQEPAFYDYRIPYGNYFLIQLPGFILLVSFLIILIRKMCREQGRTLYSSVLLFSISILFIGLLYTVFSGPHWPDSTFFYGRVWIFKPSVYLFPWILFNIGIYKVSFSKNTKSFGFISTILLATFLSSFATHIKVGIPTIITTVVLLSLTRRFWLKK